MYFHPHLFHIAVGRPDMYLSTAKLCDDIDMCRVLVDILTAVCWNIYVLFSTQCLSSVVALGRMLSQTMDKSSSMMDLHKTNIIVHRIQPSYALSNQSDVLSSVISCPAELNHLQSGSAG